MSGTGVTAAMATSWLAWAVNAGFALLLMGELLTIWRAVRGPLLSDRLIALAHSWLIGIGLIVLCALKSHNWRTLDVALALALLAGIVPLAWSWASRRSPEPAEHSVAEHSEREGKRVSDH
jgi:multisubunit Na+/H+ antiporter MnhF subunit